VNIIETRSKPSAKGFTLKNVEELKIGFGVFDGNDVCVKSFDCPEDIVEVRLLSASPRI
jgi:hypothetical protein